MFAFDGCQIRQNRLCFFFDKKKKKKKKQQQQQQQMEFSTLSYCLICACVLLLSGRMYPTPHP